MSIRKSDAAALFSMSGSPSTNDTVGGDFFNPSLSDVKAALLHVVSDYFQGVNKYITPHHLTNFTKTECAGILTPMESELFINFIAGKDGASTLFVFACYLVTYRFNM